MTDTNKLLYFDVLRYVIYLQLYKRYVSYCIVLYSVVQHPCTKKDLRNVNKFYSIIF